MALWEMFLVTLASAYAVFYVPYNGSWISIGAAFISCVVAGMASASAIFYAPLLWAAIRLKAKGNMPPLPPGSIGIPYWGESLDYLTSWNDKLNPDVWYDKRKAKHGVIFKTHILGSPTVVMLGAQANKFILTNENRLFRNSWPKSLNVLIGKHALINAQDADHKRMKRITHSVLGIETLKKSVGRFERLALHHLESDWRAGQVVVAHHKVKEMLLSVAADFFMGLKAGEELESFRRNFHDFSAGLLSQPLDLPCTAFAKAKQARAAMISQFLSLIQLCRSSLHKREEAEDNFISMVLRAQDEGNRVSLSDEEIADNLMGLFTGGYDTTASALATILKHLSLSPHVLQQLRKDCEKINDKVGGKYLTWNEIKSMEYLHNVIAEGLRIVAPINGGFKQAKVDVEYGGYTIPKGWKVHFSMRQTNNKEEYFTSPDIFDPDRFNERHDQFSYIPFGQDCEKLRDSKKVGEPLTWNEIRGVDYLKNVISEGMRIVPPVIGGFKQVKIDVVYGGYTIPKGWKVHYSIRQTSNKEEYFDSPKKFAPDRFNERHEPFSNIPFGRGNRICHGNEFAKIEMEIFLYYFVLRYDWDLMEPDEPISISFNPQPKHGLPLMLKLLA